MCALAEKWVLGSMSGTSLDGVDVALVKTDGHSIIAFGPSFYRPYCEQERAVLMRALGQWPGGAGVAEAASVVEVAHIEAMLALESQADMRADLIAFHGQTLAHDPAGRGTHQVGQGARLAAALGRPVVWDFRSCDVAAGGQGAPLAPFFHFACARYLGARLGQTGPMVFLNLGGVGNITWVDPARAAPDAPSACVAFDTGPANAPINDLMQARLGVGFDRGGALAATGRVHRGVVSSFLAHPYFAKLPPKSLDRDSFVGLQSQVAGMADADAAATLVAVAAAGVVAGLRHLPTPPERVLVGGGGRHNATLMAALGQQISCPVAPVEAVGLDGDMLEAQAFGYLAARVCAGLPLSAPLTTGVPAPSLGGQIAHPPA